MRGSKKWGGVRASKKKNIVGQNADDEDVDDG